MPLLTFADRPGRFRKALRHQGAARAALVLTALALTSPSASAALFSRPPQVDDTSTVNVYEDNRVLMVATDPQGRQILVLHGRKEVAVALRVFLAKDHIGYVNIKDAVRVSAGTGSANRFAPGIVEMKDGRSLKAAGREAVQDANGKTAYRETWVLCDQAKTCQSATAGSGQLPFTAIYAYELNSQGSGTGIYKSWSPLNLTTFTVSDDAGYAEAVTHIANYQQRKVDERNAQVQQQKDAAHAMEVEATEMRRTARIGTRTNCGLIFDVRLPMVGVQTPAGGQFLELATLYGPSASCRIANGVYVGK